MKAAIICDDSVFAAKASATLQRVGDRPDVDVDWTIANWPMSALSRADTAEKAILETADTHLIVIASGQVHSLSPHLRRWLERWATVRQVEDAAVAVMDDGNNTELSNGVSRELELLAQKHGLVFIADAMVAERATELFARSPLEPALRSSIVMARYASVGMDSIRYFGIND